MTSMFTSTFASAGALVAHLLLVAAGLVLAGLALAPRQLGARIVFAVAAAATLGFGFGLADGWIERAGLGAFAFGFGPLLLGIVVIREDQVGVVIKKFAGRSLPAGRFIALDGEAGYQITPRFRFICHR